MKVIQDNLWLCADCVQAAVNDDYSGLDYHYSEEEANERQAVIIAGLERLGRHLVLGNDEDEFSTRHCDCCGTKLAGYRHEFVILGD